MSERDFPYVECARERCPYGALMVLFDSDGNLIAHTCLKHTGDFIYEHNLLIDRTPGAYPEDVQVHPLYREAQS